MLAENRLNKMQLFCKIAGNRIVISADGHVDFQSVKLTTEQISSVLTTANKFVSWVYDLKHPSNIKSDMINTSMFEGVTLQVYIDSRRIDISQTAGTSIELSTISHLTAKTMLGIVDVADKFVELTVNNK